MGVERGPAVVRRRTQGGCLWGALLACCFFLLPALTGVSSNVYFFAWVAVVAYFKVFLPARRGVRAARANRRRPAPTSLEGLHERALEAGGGAYLATGERGELLFAPPEAAVLVLAGPRAGKTSCVVIPQILAHPGQVLATSTKPEVLQATLQARRHLGQAWFFDLQGRGAPAGTRLLRWSPVQGAHEWQRAQLVAEAMAGAAEIDRDGAHWRERAAALIACCLYAAAHSGLGMREVIGWVLRHDPAAPLAELEAGLMAVDVLEGIKHTGERERGSIFSTAARVLRAYRSEVALAASDQPNFDPDVFAASTDIIYIAASGPEQRLLAPLVAGLVTDVREARYRRHWQLGHTGPPLLLALDECANAAPLPDLPATLSEGGGQGVQTASIFQDMSQSRRHWPADADGMMSMFGAMVIMGGIADRKTLEQISLLCGEYDREVQTLSYDDNHTTVFGGPLPNARQSWTTRRERRLSPDEIARLPQGKALVIIGPDWQIVPALPYHQHPAFAKLAGGTVPAVELGPATTPAPGPRNGRAPDGGAVTEPRSVEGKEAQRP